jgi:hypothetical protein
MPTLAASLSSGRPLLWLDHTDYAGALLANNAVPWMDAAGYVAWQRKAQGLLKSDVPSLPVAAVCAAWLQARPDLAEAMAAKRRAVFPIKTLLADEALRAHLVELIRGLRACFSAQPLALVCPSPRRWVSDAYRLVHGADAEVEVGDDEADSAAMYMADFLRSFGDAGIDVLLLQESTDSEPAEDAQLELYQPVLNIAAHYRWEVGLLLPAGRYQGAAPGFAFAVAPAALPAAVAGTIVETGFWNGAAAVPCPPQGLRYAEIPADAQPEAVLQRLTELR